jgi:uncharacterized protein (TIGR00369 family)
MHEPGVLSAEELTNLLRSNFPEGFGEQSGLSIEGLWRNGCRVRLAFKPRMLRPGGTVSGPAMMALADVAVYVALLGTVGWVPLAVTNQLNINFLRKPAPGDIVAECRLLKVGKRLVVGDVSITGEHSADIVAHAAVSYAIPMSGKI